MKGKILSTAVAVFRDERVKRTVPEICAYNRLKKKEEKNHESATHVSYANRWANVQWTSVDDSVL